MDCRVNGARILMVREGRMSASRTAPVEIFEQGIWLTSS